MLRRLSSVYLVLPKPLRPAFITLRLTGLLPLPPAPLRGELLRLNGRRFAANWRLKHDHTASPNTAFRRANYRISAATNSTHRIYVACLAAYNNGHLHGRWIDATLGESHISRQTRAMLVASPINAAEEWAIHEL